VPEPSRDTAFGPFSTQTRSNLGGRCIPSGGALNHPRAKRMAKRRLFTTQCGRAQDGTKRGCSRARAVAIFNATLRSEYESLAPDGNSLQSREPQINIDVKVVPRQ
jgi:hypothetical protein